MHLVSTSPLQDLTIILCVIPISVQIACYNVTIDPTKIDMWVQTTPCTWQGIYQQWNEFFLACQMNLQNKLWKFHGHALLELIVMGKEMLKKCSNFLCPHTPYFLRSMLFNRSTTGSLQFVMLNLVQTIHCILATVCALLWCITVGISYSTIFHRHIKLINFFKDCMHAHRIAITVTMWMIVWCIGFKAQMYSNKFKLHACHDI